MKEMNQVITPAWLPGVIRVSQLSLQDIKSASKTQVRVPASACAAACLCTLDKPCAPSEGGIKINNTNEERPKSPY